MKNSSGEIRREKSTVFFLIRLSYLLVVLFISRLSYHGTAESLTGDPDKVRLDTPVRASMTLNTPMTWLANIPAFDQLTLALSGEYLSNHSNIPNYDYDNIRWQALFRKRFEF